MTLKRGFVHYCKPIPIILVSLLWISSWITLRCYIKPGQDDPVIINVDESTVLKSKSKVLELIDSEHITIVGYEPTGILYLSRAGDIYIEDRKLKKKEYKIKGVKITLPVFFKVKQALIDRGWQFFKARRPGLHISYWIKKTWFGRAPCWPRESAAGVRFTEKEMTGIFLKHHTPMFLILLCLCATFVVLWVVYSLKRHLS